MFNMFAAIAKCRPERPSSLKATAKNAKTPGKPGQEPNIRNIIGRCRELEIAGFFGLPCRFKVAAATDRTRNIGTTNRHGGARWRDSVERAEKTPQTKRVRMRRGGELVLRGRLVNEFQRARRSNILEHLNEVFAVGRHGLTAGNVELARLGDISNLLHQIDIGSSSEADGDNWIV